MGTRVKNIKEQELIDTDQHGFIENYLVHKLDFLL